MRRKIALIAAIAGALAMLSAGPAAAAGEPTCTELDGIDLGIVVHGHHVVRDYVMGTPTWPPAGSANAAGGAAIPGGPGPGFHFEHGFAPGASFCTDSSSPGLHFAG